METHEHSSLKNVATSFLRRLGCPIIAKEVSCPIARYRVDVAAYWDRLPARPADRGGRDLCRSLWEQSESPRKSRSIEPRTIVIECKQSRADFLRDRRDREELFEERERLQRTRQWMERERIQAFEPHLRREGSSLFPELEEWDYDKSRIGDYQALMRRLEAIEDKLYRQTKFCLVERYRLADRLYLMAPRGLIRPNELPPGWGLLECPPAAVHPKPSTFNTDAEIPVRVRVASQCHPSPQRMQLRLLRNIAAAATRSVIADQSTRVA